MRDKLIAIMWSLILTTAFILLALGGIVGIFAFLAAERPTFSYLPESPRWTAIKEQMRLAGLALQPVVTGPRLTTHYKGQRLFIRQTESGAVQIIAPLPIHLRDVRLLIADASAVRAAAFTIGQHLWEVFAHAPTDAPLDALTFAETALEHTFRIAGYPAFPLNHILSAHLYLRQILLDTPPGLLLTISDRRLIISPGVRETLALSPADWQTYFELAITLRAALLSAIPRSMPTAHRIRSD